MQGRGRSKKKNSSSEAKPHFSCEEREARRTREMSIFTYSTEHLAQKDKVRFYYALKGRDGVSGVVRAWRIEQLGKTVLLVDAACKNDVTEFLQFWKCVFQERKVYVEQ